MVRIKKLLDDRENILGSHSDFTFVFHIVVVLLTKKCAAIMATHKHKSNYVPVRSD